MIAFTTAVVDPEAYRRFARPGIERAAEPGSTIQVFEAVGSEPRSANLLLDAAAGLEDLEALVIVDQRAEIVDAALCAKVRRVLADPDVAVAGCVGATGVRGIAWWDGQVTSGPVTLRYSEHGTGELPAFGFANPAPAPREVEAVAGFLLVLSPWAVRELRFDEALHLGFGYDVEFCRRVRAAGRKVVAADLAVTWHHSIDLVSEGVAWMEAHVALASRDDRLLQPPARRRARARARAAARGGDEHPVVAAHGAAAAPQRSASSSTARISSFEMTEEPGAIRARTRSRESRSAMANALDSSRRRSTASRRASRRSRSHPSACRA
jgi:Glycosyltransferase like family